MTVCEVKATILMLTRQCSQTNKYDYRYNLNSYNALKVITICNAFNVRNEKKRLVKASNNGESYPMTFTISLCHYLRLSSQSLLISFQNAQTSIRPTSTQIYNTLVSGLK